MPVPETKNVSNDGGRCHAARILEAHRKPCEGFFVTFSEVVPHDGPEPLTDTHEVVRHLRAIIATLRLFRLHLFQYFARPHIAWSITVRRSDG